MKHYLVVALAALLIPTAVVAQDRGKDKGKNPHAMPKGHPPLPPGALPPNHPPFPPGMDPHDPKAMLKALGANDQQVEQVMQIHREGMLQAVDLQAASKKAHMQLKFLHDKADATEAEFIAGIDAAHNAQAAIMKAHVRLTFQIKKVVGPEIFKKIKNHLPMMHGGQAHPGMGHGMGGGMGGHPGMGGRRGMGGMKGHPGMGGMKGRRGMKGRDGKPDMRFRWKMDDDDMGGWGRDMREFGEDMREWGERMRGREFRDPEDVMRMLRELGERMEKMRGKRGKDRDRKRNEKKDDSREY